jgi:RimJ/RimL family protein N-acetyltransferase
MKLFNQIETDRLLIRPFSLNDDITKMNWFFDPLVMGQTIGDVEKNLKTLQLRIDRYISHQLRYGYSKWLVLDKYSGKYIGDCGIYTLFFEGQLIDDIGFRLASEYWRKGIGSEMTKSWIYEYFALSPFNLLYAHIEPDNYKSKTLLSKLGFKYEKSVTVYGEILNRYYLDKKSYDESLNRDE